MLPNSWELQASLRFESSDPRLMQGTAWVCLSLHHPRHQAGYGDERHNADSNHEVLVGVSVRLRLRLLI